MRSHAELTLEMVTDRERDYLWATYAADIRARINLGIRRRLAPLMENDRRKIELLNSLLMSMPGTPILYYGDEIGMGDNIYLGDRNGVRTPMQWSPDRNGGFSRADPASLFLPPLMDPIYGFQTVNVEAQTRNAASLLNWTKRLIAVRKGRAVFGRGEITFLYPSNRQILAYVRSHGDESVLCVANLSRSAQAVSLDLTAYKGLVPIEMLGKSQFPQIGDSYYTLTLPPYSFYWFDLVPADQLAAPVTLAEPIIPDLVTLVVTNGIPSLVEGRNRSFIERDILPPFLKMQRWFAAKGAAGTTTVLTDVVELPGEADPVFLTFAESESSGQTDRYSLPVVLLWQSVGDMPATLLPRLIAKTRFGSREGVLMDAAALPTFGPALVRAMQQGMRLPLDEAELRFTAAGAAADLDFRGAEARLIGGEQSNTSMVIEGQAVVKLYRRLEPGIHPEIEIGRFLTEAAYANFPALIGAVEHVGPTGTRTAVAVAHHYVQNQGDAWSFTLGYLRRQIDELVVIPDAELEERTDMHREYRSIAEVIGRRLAEMHLALASRADLPDFAPEAIGPVDMEHWSAQARDDGRRALERLKEQRGMLAPDARELADILLARDDEIADRLKLPEGDVGLLGNKIRVHGDMHLGQILVAQNDVFIIDFEGEPNRPIRERRYKTAALADVAGMLRSFDYAAWATVLQMTPGHEPRRERLERIAFAWRDAMAAALLGAYRDAIRSSPHFPAGDAADRLLRLLTLTRVFYEIGYELANRPSWAVIPLAGARDLLFPRPREVDDGD